MKKCGNSNTNACNEQQQQNKLATTATWIWEIIFGVAGATITIGEKESFFAPHIHSPSLLSMQLAHSIHKNVLNNNVSQKQQQQQQRTKEPNIDVELFSTNWNWWSRNRILFWSSPYIFEISIRGRCILSLQSPLYPKWSKIWKPIVFPVVGW